MRRLAYTGCLSVMLQMLVVPAQGDEALLRQTIRAYGAIRTIDAEIEQHIMVPKKAPELFRGRYRAAANGLFRIDYRMPYRQIVLNRGSVLYWYYPDDKLLYTVGSGDGVANPPINPLAELGAGLDDKFTIQYSGKALFGFFTVARQYIITDRGRNLAIDLWIDPAKKALLARVVRRGGIEVLKEIYGGYTAIGGSWFPSRVDVYARTPEGIVRNTTHYSAVRLNTVLPPHVFELTLPRDIVRRTYGR